MRKVEVNLPDHVYGECLGFEESSETERIALDQAIRFYPWVGEALVCLALACRRDKHLRQSFDLGEPKEEVKKRWDREDAVRFAQMGSGFNDEDETMREVMLHVQRVSRTDGHR